MEQRFKDMEITLPIKITVSGGLIRAGNTPEEGAYKHDPTVYLEVGKLKGVWHVLPDWIIGYLEDNFQADLLDQIKYELDIEHYNRR